MKVVMRSAGDGLDGLTAARACGTLWVWSCECEDKIKKTDVTVEIELEDGVSIEDLPHICNLVLCGEGVAVDVVNSTEGSDDLTSVIDAV